MRSLDSAQKNWKRTDTGGVGFLQRMVRLNFQLTLRKIKRAVCVLIDLINGHIPIRAPAKLDRDDERDRPERDLTHLVFD